MHPIFLKIGSYEIRWYGVMIAIAVLTGVFYAWREAKKEGIDEDKYFDFVIWVIIVGIIGARVVFVLANNPLFYLTHPLEILKIWHGGLAFFGIVIFGFLFTYFYWRRFGLFYKILDIAAPALALGFGIGRIGCFLNGCCYGKPTSVPWAVVFHDPASFGPIGIPIHPTQLYLSASGFIAFFILNKVKKRIKVEGGLFVLFLVLYSIWTFIIEFFRGDHMPIFGLTNGQWSVFPILLFAYLFYRSSPTLRHGKEKPEDENSLDSSQEEKEVEES